MTFREQLHAYIAQLEQRLRWSTLLRGVAILTGSALVATLVLVAGTAVSVALAALTINVGAYATEIMRAGFDSIHKGQLEAAECLALSRRQVYWHVVLLPAPRSVRTRLLPPRYALKSL